MRARASTITGKRLVLFLIVSLLTIAAALAVGILLFGDFGETEGGSSRRQRYSPPTDCWRCPPRSCATGGGGRRWRSPSPHSRSGRHR